MNPDSRNLKNDINQVRPGVFGTSGRLGYDCYVLGPSGDGPGAQTISKATLDFQEGCTMVIGAFDGVHKGHRRLIAQAHQWAVAHDQKLYVLTFLPDPDEYFAAFRLGMPERLDSDESRMFRLLHVPGVDGVIGFNFDDNLAECSYQDFMKILSDRFEVRHLFVGKGFRLGHKGLGTVEALKREAEALVMEVHDCDLVMDETQREKVSSTQIRKLISEGSIGSAAKLLGHWPQVEGRVVSGRHLGHTLGFPTANIQVAHVWATPPQGVYAGWCKVEGRTYPAAIHVGQPPSFASEAHRGADNSVYTLMEAFLMGFHGSIYDLEVQLQFVAFVSEDQVFSSREELQKGIEGYIRQVEGILSDTSPCQ